MSYQVLARKWRPKSFGTLVGQEHVVRALSHALETGRLHHAWLFTGTRGVGKTTISRILAKALNCETGVTAEPCNVCEACRAIDADRFPDYVEMDAASNRGVDDMAALLDKAVYAPVQGRYKVYMIDEVHMLTGHAFNAMLKTLEEPPEHVKFILATTDPQKIPVTVLSRCLQFNLKQMPPGHIVDHLSRILTAEAVEFEPGALRHLARAASGSMRDALSLLDQAIAHGAGKVEEAGVTQMLGTVGDDHLHAVLDALAAGDVPALLAAADDMEARSLSFDAALQALATLLHRVALVQYAPTAIADETERARMLVHAGRFDPEWLQLAYQIAIHGRDELALAPDEYTGFTMTLLRLHAFRPEQPPPLGGPLPPAEGGGRARALPPAAPAGRAGTASVAAGVAPAATRAAVPAAAAPAPVPAAAAVIPRPVPVTVPAPEPEAPAAAVPARAATTGPVAEAESARSPVIKPAPVHDVPPWEDLPPEALAGQQAGPAGPAWMDEEAAAPASSPASSRIAPTPAASRATAGRSDAGRPAAQRSVASSPVVTRPAAPQPVRPEPAAAEPAAAMPVSAPQLPSELGADIPALMAAADWRGLIRALGLSGLVRELAQHCTWLAHADGQLQLRLSPTHRHLLDMNRGAVERIQDQLGAALGLPLRISIELGDSVGETPAQRDEIERRARHAEAVAQLESDPFVRELMQRFDATLIEASVRAL